MVPLIHKQILVTLAYVVHFGFPLTAQEVWERLIVIGGDRGFSVDQVVAGLTELEKAGLIVQTQGYYRVKQTNKVYLTPNERQQRAAWAIDKVMEAAPFIAVCKRLPWVKAVAITGSVAVGNALKDDDVDFLIICQKERLWLMRPLLVGVASWYGKRRTWAGEEKNSWCLNFWLDESALELQRDRHSLYTAYELCQAQWVVNKNQTAERFLLANLWAGKIVPNLFIKSYTALARTSSLPHDSQSWSSKIFRGSWKLVDRGLGELWATMNGLAYGLQRQYMKHHQTREEVSIHAAFFHPRDTKGSIMKTLNTTLGQPPQDGFDQAVKISQQARAAGQQVVLVTGVFDLLHAAHKEFLRRAKQVGDVLIIGVESDVRVRQLKGEGRPVQTQTDRVAALEQLGLAAAVFILPENFGAKEDHQRLIQTIKPDVLAVSAHTPHLVKKQALLAENGGRVEVVMELDPSISTTQLLQSEQA